MSRLNISLLLLLVVCALSTVAATNRQRELFIELGRAQSEAHQMAQTYAELQYQQGALSKTTLIEHVATAQLKMQPATLGRTQYIVVNRGAAAQFGVVPEGAVAAIDSSVAADSDAIGQLANGRAGASRDAAAVPSRAVSGARP